MSHSLDGVCVCVVIVRGYMKRGEQNTNSKASKPSYSVLQLFGRLMTIQCLMPLPSTRLSTLQLLQVRIRTGRLYLKKKKKDTCPNASYENKLFEFLYILNSRYSIFLCKCLSRSD